MRPADPLRCKALTCKQFISIAVHDNTSRIALAKPKVDIPLFEIVFETPSLANRAALDCLWANA